MRSGKTTLLSVLAHGAPVETVPTIGLNVKVFKKGSVNMKCWDIGGQEQYRSEWSRYTKGSDVVLYVVDSAAPQKLGTAKKELHKLLDDGSIGSTPMLILANKIDLNPHVGEAELIDKLQLNYVMETPWMGTCIDLSTTTKQSLTTGTIATHFLFVLFLKFLHTLQFSP
jgi:Arf/Sar family protein